VLVDALEPDLDAAAREVDRVEHPVVDHDQRPDRVVDRVGPDRADLRGRDPGEGAELRDLDPRLVDGAVEARVESTDPAPAGQEEQADRGGRGEEPVEERVVHGEPPGPRIRETGADPLPRAGRPEVGAGA
jgi:hypothetical protein